MEDKEARQIIETGFFSEAGLVQSPFVSADIKGIKRMGVKMGKKKQPKKVRIKAKDIYEEIARRMNLFPEDVASVFECMNDVVSDYLMMANEDLSVSVQITSGFWLTSCYIPYYVSVLPKTQEPIVVDEKIRFGCRFTRYFRRQKNKEFQEKKELLEAWNEFNNKADNT